MLYEEKLQEIVNQIKEGIKPQPVSARTFIGWFGAQRRSTWNVWYIRDNLSKYKLATDPDFEYAYIDSFINIVSAPKKKTVQTEETVREVRNDPTYRIGKLASANKPPISVKPDDSVSKVITQMMAHDYSQVPVMTNERDVKGMITWDCLASKYILSKGCKYVRECMIPHKEISYETYIFSAIDDIIANQYVLIRNKENIICGIVTTSDLSQQFRQLGEPFLLIGEVENYVRIMLLDKFTIGEIRAACESSEQERRIERISDLTLGGYIRLIENPTNWEKISFPVDREVVINKLDDIRQIRNDVMHFDPDGISEQELEKLRDLVRLMQTLARVGAI